MYQMTLDPKGTYVDGVKIVTPDEVRCIPLKLENKECRKFLRDWRSGVELQDVSGVAVPFTRPNFLALGFTVFPDDEGL